MRPSTLFCFLARCLTMDTHPERTSEVTELIRTGAIPWEEFVWTGSSHYVLPALWSSLKRNGLTTLLPEDLQEHLEHIYNLNLQRNNQILVQCRHITSLLNPSGIQPVFIKGAGFLLSGLHPDQGDRMMEDIDIFLPAEEIPEALSVLMEGGYAWHEMKEQSDAYTDHHHLPPMYHPRQVASLEIHHAPIHDDYAGLMSSGAFWDHSSCIKDVGGRIPSAGHAQLLIFLHEHRSSRGFLSSTGSLKGLFDFYLLSGLRRPDPADLPPGKYRKRYIRYVYFAAQLFNESSLFPVNETAALMRFWNTLLFLLDHPGWDTFWHDQVYATANYLSIVVKASWSREAAKLARMKTRKFFSRTG